MASRTAVVIASFLIGLGAVARESFAQYYPPQAYPRPRDYPLAGYPPLPPVEADDDYELPAQFRRTLVDYYTKQPAGTIVIDTPNTYLYLVLGNGKALRYGIGVGREGFTWS